MRRQLIKWLAGLFYYLIGGPLIHAYLMLTNRAVYQQIDAFAWPVYSRLWNRIVLPHLAPLVVLLVLIEMAMGALMLSRRPRWAALGQAGGFFFNLLLVPFWFFYAVPNLLLAARTPGCSRVR